MLIPNKFNGYSRDGRRLYFMGGGGGGDPAPPPPAPAPTPIPAPRPAPPPPNFTPNPGNMDLVNKAYGNIGRASVGVGANQIDQGGQNYWMNQLNSGAIRPQDFSSIFSNAAQADVPELSNRYQNQALSQISGARPNTYDYSKPILDSAGKPTGSYEYASQFYQPVFQSQYQNYARPSTQFDTSLYGTQPMNSPAFNSGMSRGNINNAISNFYQTNPAGQNATASDTLNFMRSSGVNREDFQAYGGKNNYGPRMSMPSMQSPFSYQQPMQQMQSPFSYQQPAPQMNWQTGQMAQPSAQPATQPIPMPTIPTARSTQNQFSYQPQMQTPFSYQQPSYQPTQLPQYVYDTINDLGAYKSQPVAQRTSSGPSTAIVGRSSQMRGTPNVAAAPVTKAEGGIASLLDDYK